MKIHSKLKKVISITPSTLKLNQMMAGRGHGMLTQEEIGLLRKSKQEIAEVCKNARNLKGNIESEIMKSDSTSTANQAYIHELAVRTFGSESEADAWLNQLHPVLGGIPITISESFTGRIEVERVLNEIKYGGVV